MKILQIIALFFAVLLLTAILQLPDRISATAGADWSALPQADLLNLAESNWSAGRRAAALENLNYIIANRLKSWMIAAERREYYVRQMLSDPTATGRLTALGLEAEPQSGGSFEEMAGMNLADAILRTDLSALIAETRQESALFIKNIQASAPITSLLPQADLAFLLLKSAFCMNILQPALQNQLTDRLAPAQILPITPMALAVAQETLLPVNQLAKTCRTWNEFAALLKQARSIEQLKTLVKIAAHTPSNARKLVQILMIADTESPRQAATLIDVIIKRGASGMDLLYAAAGKGPIGMTWIAEHPANASTSLSDSRRSLAPAWMLEYWRKSRAQFGVKAVILKYILVAPICALLLITLIPAFGKTGLPAINRPLGRKNYWIAAMAVGATISLLLLLGAFAPGTSALQGANIEASSGSKAPSGASGASSESTLNPLSMAVMVAGILIVQGICWMIAHRRIKDVENDTEADNATKLRRLENLDIFLDLPLYGGLAVTIFSFIMITTYGVGVARFLAYSSTLVGIVMAVALRLFYLYPLREYLITGKE